VFPRAPPPLVPAQGSGFAGLLGYRMMLYWSCGQAQSLTGFTSRSWCLRRFPCGLHVLPLRGPYHDPN